MDDNEKIRVEIALPRWVFEALERWPIPAEHCGESVGERLAFLADDMAVSITEAERKGYAPHGPKLLQ